MSGRFTCNRPACTEIDERISALKRLRFRWQHRLQFNRFRRPRPLHAAAGLSIAIEDRHERRELIEHVNRFVSVRQVPAVSRCVPTPAAQVDCFEIDRHALNGTDDGSHAPRLPRRVRRFSAYFW